tara:strand:- start:213 stop:734 length:522 start_codon:yes stop_codon:yes gene_type:complete
MNGPDGGKGSLKFSNGQIFQLLKENNWRCSDCESEINNKNNSPFPPHCRLDENYWECFGNVVEYGLAKYNDINVKRKKTRGTPNNTSKNSDGSLNLENLLLLCKSCYIINSKEVSISFRTSKNKRELLQKIAKSKEINLTELMNEIVDNHQNDMDEEYLSIKEILQNQERKQN